MERLIQKFSEEVKEWRADVNWEFLKKKSLGVMIGIVEVCRKRF